MRIPYSQYRRLVEELYEDYATIYRYEYVKNPNTGVDEKQLVPKYEDQACRISQKALGTMNQTDAQNNIFYDIKLFISPDVEIQQGDYIKVTRNATERHYEAGEPFLYRTHQEVSLQRREWA